MARNPPSAFPRTSELVGYGALRRLILLRHRARWPVRVNLRAQQGHRGSRVRAIATANLRCSVAIESGTCRCGRIGGAAGSVTGGKGRYFEPPEETRSPLVVTQPDLLLELLIIALDPPAHFGDID